MYEIKYIRKTEGTLLKVPVKRIEKKSAFLRKLEKSQRVEAKPAADVLPMFLRRQAE